MSYIFEDHPDDSLSRLFKKSYSNDVSSKFIYAQSVSNVKKLARQELRKTENEMVYVFMDMVSNNINLIQIYKYLSKKSQDSNYRLVVLPLVCAEYYFICSLSEYTILDKETMDLCINRLPFTNAKIVQSVKKVPATFEQFCKLILCSGVIDCIKRDSSNNNPMYDFYFNKDCRCESSLRDCLNLTLQEKSKQFLGQYPCIPANHIFENTENSLHFNDIWQVHRQLVDEFNTMVDIFKNSNSSPKGYYEHIEYIK